MVRRRKGNEIVFCRKKDNRVEIYKLLKRKCGYSTTHTGAGGCREKKKMDLFFLIKIARVVSLCEKKRRIACCSRMTERDVITREMRLN